MSDHSSLRDRHVFWWRNRMDANGCNLSLVHLETYIFRILYKNVQWTSTSHVDPYPYLIHIIIIICIFHESYQHGHLFVCACVLVSPICCLLSSFFFCSIFNCCHSFHLIFSAGARCILLYCFALSCRFYYVSFYMNASDGIEV